MDNEWSVSTLWLPEPHHGTMVFGAQVSPHFIQVFVSRILEFMKPELTKGGVWKKV